MYFEKDQAKPVNAVIPASGGSEVFTVPEGEVWDVTMTVSNSNSSNERLFINEDETPHYAARWHHDYKNLNVVLEGEDELYTHDNGTPATFVSGYDVSEIIDNPVVNEVVEPGATLTIPENEVWEVTLFNSSTGNSGWVYVNGDETYDRAFRVNSSSGSARTWGASRNVFKGGDTIEFDSDSGCAHWLSGYVVNEDYDEADY